MDLSKIVWVIVILAVGIGIWSFTDGGMDKKYEEATKNLVGNDPDQDIKDEATLSSSAATLLAMMRYEDAKKFYTAAITRYGTNGKNFWYNQQELARCEEKLGNDLAAIKILHMLWVEDGDAHDERVSSRDQLKPRVLKLVEMNQLHENDYRMDDKRRR